MLLQFPQGTIPEDMFTAMDAAGREGGATLYVNGIDPGSADDVLPLVVTRLARRIVQNRVGGIADYSLYRRGATMRRLRLRAANGHPAVAAAARSPAWRLARSAGWARRHPEGRLPSPRTGAHARRHREGRLWPGAGWRSVDAVVGLGIERVGLGVDVAHADLFACCGQLGIGRGQ